MVSLEFSSSAPMVLLNIFPMDLDGFKTGLKGFSGYEGGIYSIYGLAGLRGIPSTTHATSSHYKMIINSNSST